MSPARAAVRAKNPDRTIRRLLRLNRAIDRTLLIVLLLIAGIAGSALLDSFILTQKGLGSDGFHDFGDLLAANPDTVAWLKIDGTKVDHPVVQGKDNFEYLNKAFTGEYYVGGTLFLDCANDRDLSDRYNMIHGHHMDGGAMFGSLTRFLSGTFLEEHHEGTLFTPEYDYSLDIIAAGEFTAGDGRVYGAGGEVPAAMIGTCPFRRGEARARDRILALSTCSGDMSDGRIIVFCRMVDRRPHGRAGRQEEP